jgi:hypothetical protein
VNEANCFNLLSQNFLLLPRWGEPIHKSLIIHTLHCVCASKALYAAFTGALLIGVSVDVGADGILADELDTFYRNKPLQKLRF